MVSNTKLLLELAEPAELVAVVKVTAIQMTMLLMELLTPEEVVVVVMKAAEPRLQVDQVLLSSDMQQHNSLELVI